MEDVHRIVPSLGGSAFSYFGTTTLSLLSLAASASIL